MTDPAILYAGMFCLACALLGAALTVYEFRKMTAASNSKRKLVDKR